jgi:hypothetical protein
VTHRQIGDAAAEAGNWLRRSVLDGELDLPLPGAGATAERFTRLIRIATADPVRARLAEGHADAVAILAELGGPDPARDIWGVWAARPQSVTARRTATGWRLDGERDWCSGATTCTRALLTAAAPDGVRLFAVEVTGPGLVVVPDSWPAVGMAASDSSSVRLQDVAAQVVGGPEDYTQRPGFWHGAIGVAACWYGGACGVARPLDAAARRQRPADPHLLAHLGAVDACLAAAAALLDRAAALIDAAPAGDLRLPAMRVRAVVEAAAREVLDRTGRALGAGPLCRDGAHARRVADLTVYLRQHHGERDLAELGAAVAAAAPPEPLTSSQLVTGALR